MSYPMKIVRGFEDPDSYQGGYVAIGNFDGVHRGHQCMIATLVARARTSEVPAVVFAFDPHPIELLSPAHAPPSLSTLSQKAELLAACGVDCTIAYPTDDWLLELSAREFFDRIVCGELRARGLVEGPNFFFGRNREGDVETLAEFCTSGGLSLDVVKPVMSGNDLVSSSTIRSRLAAGDVRRATELLGHRYAVQGLVERGAGRGRTIGFPTANVGGVKTLLPAQGVYAGIARVGGSCYTAAINLGPNLTFGEQSVKFEVYLDEFDGDLYGTDLIVEFVDRVRDVRVFADVQQLTSQLAVDLEAVRECLAIADGK